MPTYEYKCEKCGVYEHVQSITEPALERCPHCGGSTKRLISRSVGIVFKGAGFYATDNRHTSAGKGAPGQENTSTETKEVTKEAKEDKADKGANKEVKTESTTKESATKAAGDSKPKAEAS